jgi:hypothetical protein
MVVPDLFRAAMCQIATPVVVVTAVDFGVFFSTVGSIADDVAVIRARRPAEA